MECREDLVSIPGAVAVCAHVLSVAQTEKPGPSCVHSEQNTETQKLPQQHPGLSQPQEGHSAGEGPGPGFAHSVNIQHKIIHFTFQMNWESNSI